MPDQFAADAGRTIPIYVGTTRERSDDGLWSSSRSGPLNYSVMDVNVLPDREPGIVRLPRGAAEARTDFRTGGIAAVSDRAAFVSAARRSKARDGVDDCQNTQLAAGGELVLDEVHRPCRVRRDRLAAVLAELRLGSAL